MDRESPDEQAQVVDVDAAHPIALARGPDEMQGQGLAHPATNHAATFGSTWSAARRGAVRRSGEAASRGNKR